MRHKYVFRRLYEVLTPHQCKITSTRVLYSINIPFANSSANKSLIPFAGEGVDASADGVVVNNNYFCHPAAGPRDPGHENLVICAHEMRTNNKVYQSIFYNFLKENCHYRVGGNRV